MILKVKPIVSLAGQPWGKTTTTRETWANQMEVFASF